MLGKSPSEVDLGRGFQALPKQHRVHSLNNCATVTLIISFKSPCNISLRPLPN